MVTDIAGTRN